MPAHRIEWIDDAWDRRNPRAYEAVGVAPADTGLDEPDSPL
ncbi:hypothetical protein [Geodermatophilus sp. URMC 60]